VSKVCDAWIALIIIPNPPLALSEALKADHGFNGESRAIRDLIEVMSEYSPSMRRAYLQFITGSPKLPIGGKLILSVISVAC